MRQASRALLGACSRRRGLSSTAGEEGSLVWSQLQHEAQAALKTPAFSRFGMGKFLEREVLARASLADALSPAATTTSGAAADRPPSIHTSVQTRRKRSSSAAVDDVAGGGSSADAPAAQQHPVFKAMRSCR